MNFVLSFPLPIAHLALKPGQTNLEAASTSAYHIATD